MIDPMPPVHSVFTMAIKLEKKIKGNNAYNEVNHANAVMNETQGQEFVVAFNAHGGGADNRRKFSNNGNKTAKCPFCGMTGHTWKNAIRSMDTRPGGSQVSKARANRSRTKVGEPIFKQT